MENCLKKILKGVADAELPTFNTLEYIVPAGTSDFTFGVGSFPSQVLSWDNNVVVTNNNGTVTYTSPQTIPYDIGLLVTWKISSVNGGRLNLKAKNKMRANTPGYGLVNLPRAFDNTLDDLKYWYKGTELDISNNTEIFGELSGVSTLTQLTQFNMNGITHIYGSLADLSNLTNLINIWMNNTVIGGDFDNLGKLTSLGLLRASNTQISGNIEDFVIAQYGNGRTTCSQLKMSTDGTHVKFLNTEEYNGSSITLTWEPVSGENKIHITYNGQETNIDIPT